MNHWHMNHHLNSIFNPALGVWSTMKIVLCCLMNVADHIRTCRADEPSRRRLLDEGFIEDVWAKKKEAVCRCSPNFNEYFKLIVIRMTCRIVQAVEEHERRARQFGLFGLFGGSGSKKLFLLLFLPPPFIIVIVGGRGRSGPLWTAFLQIPLPFVVGPGPFPLLLAPLSSRYSIFKNLFDPHPSSFSLFFPFHRPPFLRGGIGRLYFSCHRKWTHHRPLTVNDGHSAKN